MTKKCPLRIISKGLNISLKTAFVWRHKILDNLSKIKTEKLSGIIEADETF